MRPVRSFGKNLPRTNLPILAKGLGFLPRSTNALAFSSAAASASTPPSVCRRWSLLTPPQQRFGGIGRYGGKFMTRSFRSSPVAAARLGSIFGSAATRGSDRGDSNPQQPETSTSKRVEYFMHRLQNEELTKRQVLTELNLLRNEHLSEVDRLRKQLNATLFSLSKAGGEKKKDFFFFFGLLAKAAFYLAVLYLLYRLIEGTSAGGGGLGEMMEDNFEEWFPPGYDHPAAKPKSRLSLSLRSSKETQLEQKAEAEKAKEQLVKFIDVKGNMDAKEELKDLVDYLRNPEKYVEKGLKLPKGVLLAGPPGTGKTLLARALAGEANVPFIAANGASFDQMLVGLGAHRVRKLFQRAKELAPCIIFIDEIDALGARRNTPQNYSRQTLNQLLGQLDGFTQSDGVVRPGRFDRTVQIVLPDRKIRKEMVEKFTKGKLAKEVDLDLLARQTAGMTGADLANICNRAGIEALKNAKISGGKITNDTLTEALETVMMGRANKDTRMSELTQKIVSYHEAGHALVALYTRGSDPVYKATMLPRGPALGFVASTRKDEHLKSKLSYLAQIDVCMAGRAAEELLFGEINTTQGASSDFQQASRIALDMVARFGMGGNEVGKVFYDDDQLSRLSPEELAKINREVKKLLDSSYSRVKSLLTEKKREHTLLAEALLSEETLDAAQIKKRIGWRKEDVRPPTLSLA